MYIEKLPAVYIVASRFRGTLYIGVTSDLWTRICDHKNKVRPGFTSRYGVGILVWYEHHHTMEKAIKREKQLKEWKRAWKIRLIEATNKDWLDLHDSIDAVSTLVDE